MIESMGGTTKSAASPHNLHIIMSWPSRDSRVNSFLLLLELSIKSEDWIKYKKKIVKNEIRGSVAILFTKQLTTGNTFNP